MASLRLNERFWSNTLLRASCAQLSILPHERIRGRLREQSQVDAVPVLYPGPRATLFIRVPFAYAPDQKRFRQNYNGV